jgi:SAM-dependent methyltransferase
MTDITDKFDFDYPNCLKADFGDHLPLAIAVVDDVLGWMRGVDFAPLARRSPGLQEFGWANYLHCSITRMVHVAAALARRRTRATRVLDYGSYFGNFALMLRQMGAEVVAIDSYRAYAGVFDGGLDLLHRAGVRTCDFADVGYDLQALGVDGYDLVLCLGVIEHIPGTPRFMLEALDRVLRPGGALVVDTPNLVHVYNRVKFCRGESVMPDVATPYYSDQPFEGHHREYTQDELVWMLHQIGHTSISVEMFNYSSYGLGSLVGRDIYHHWVMVRDPTMRELVMTVSTKPVPLESAAARAEWGDVRFEDPETFWRRAMPSSFLETADPLGLTREALLANLQKEIDYRDHALADMDAHFQDEVNRRDGLLRDLEARMQAEIQLRDGLLSNLRRKLDVLTGRAALRALARLFDRR